MKTELRRTIHADNKTTIGIQRSDQRLIIAMPVSTTTAPATGVPDDFHEKASTKEGAE
ncbi:hypothetical protein J4734_25315 [Klebsiella pneumoniae]|uniref:Uncharacterized protein n=1 Tax=Klebsiella pneumoniae TaxID=573 RepID=A0A939NNN5_KLEPN|nr:hypothetical protein [Klebsiella pneumoniae]